jgi:hypothetical protein
MLLFRSEEHRDNWLVARGLRRGATLSVVQQWELARIWYGDQPGAGSAGPHNRMSPDWRRRTPDEAQAVFDSLGLTGPFWKLSG